MKKLASLAVLAMISAIGVTAFADASVAYTGGAENTATVAGVDGYSTVLIIDSNDNIVYVNEEDGTFSGVKDFLMKNGIPGGVYTATFGSSSDAPITKTFYVGVNSEESGDVPMTRLSSNLSEDNTTYSTGFFRTVGATELSAFKSLKVGYDNGTKTVWGGFALNGFPQTTGEGELTLIFELGDIEADEIDSVNVFLSSKEVVPNTRAYEQ